MAGDERQVETVEQVAALRASVEVAAARRKVAEAERLAVDNEGKVAWRFVYHRFDGTDHPFVVLALDAVDAERYAAAFTAAAVGRSYAEAIGPVG